MNAQERLRAARDKVSQGLHEDALREFQWFHAHALEERPSLYGVRLSFALSAWAELGAVYPPARQALEEVRERDTALLLAGQAGFQLFHDVASINETLGERERTHALFARLIDIAPELAQSCFNIALPSIIASADFELAERMLPEPAQFVREQCDMLLRVFRHRRKRFTEPPHFTHMIDHYARDVGMLITMLEGRGRRSEAARIRTLAADLIHVTTLRRSVRAALLPSARSSCERGRPRPRPARLS